MRTPEYSVELQCCRAAALPAIYRHLHIVSVFLDEGSVVVREDASGSAASTRYASGESSIHPSGPRQRVEWPRGAHALHVHLHPRMVRHVAQTMFGVPRISLQACHRLVDPVIREIGLEMSHLVSGPAVVQAGDVHDLVMALTHHVVGAYSTEATPPLYVGTLAVEALLDMLREEVATWEGVAALAQRAGLSRSHFTRRFREVIGLPPKALAMGSRIEAAKHLLERPRVPVSGVAYRTGFADQSHLTRAFRRATGTTPARYRSLRSQRRS